MKLKRLITYLKIIYYIFKIKITNFKKYLILALYILNFKITLFFFILLKLPFSQKIIK